MPVTKTINMPGLGTLSQKRALKKTEEILACYMYFSTLALPLELALLCMHIF
jgi:hypothetical protein